MFFETNSAIDWASYGWLALILAAAFLVVAVAVLVARRLVQANYLPPNFRQKVFLLTVPQQYLDGNQEKKPIKEILAGIENLYANLGGMKAAKGLKAWFFGRFDHWSLEMVFGRDHLVSFYLSVPRYLEDYFHQQILSQYPSCQIEEVVDYNIFQATGFAAAGCLRLVKDKMFPILTYKQMEIDPMVSVLSALAKLPDNTAAAVQLVMRSAPSDWRRRGVKVASIVHQGKSLKQALNESGGNALIGALGQPSEWFYGAKKDQPAKETYRLSPMEEQAAKAIEEKASKAGMEVNVRIVTFAQNENSAKDVWRQIANAFAQYFSYQYANGFKAVIKGSANKIISDFIFRRFDPQINMVLNTEELTSLWHLPLPGTDVPKINWLQARRLAPPVNLPSQGLILGESYYRGQSLPVKIKDADRRRHMYIIGMTGSGKSWLMANLAIQDIKNGKGVCVIDPHGTLIDDILPHIPKERAEDVILFNPADLERPVGLNMLEAKTPGEMDFATQEMINIFYKLLPDPSMAGPMFEHYMRNALLALMADTENPGTLVELARIFTDEDFRREKLKHVRDILVKDFWEREYTASQKGSTGADMLSYVISKTGRFVENELMRNIIGQPHSGFNFREVMDGRKILLMNLSKGKVGETNSALLGLIAVSKLQMAALSRADLPEEQRHDFYLYIDEFQNFITDSISIILAEARKYKLNLIMAHQYIAQLTQNNDTRVRDAVFGNVGTLISFRIGVDDSEVIAKQLAPKVGEYDLLNIEKFNAYVRLLIDNTASETFNIKALPLPPASIEKAVTQAIMELSRLKYGREKNLVIREIMERSKLGQMGRKIIDTPSARGV